MTAWLKDVIGYGTHAARPAAGSAGALYYETDTTTLLRDNGTGWDVLTIGGAGAAPAAAVRCYNSANISIPNATTTALTFDTNLLDQGTSIAQHSTSSNPSRLTCQQAGVHQITGLVQWSANATGSYRQTYIRLNGATNIGYINGQRSAGDNTTNVVTSLYPLAVNDYVELVCYQDSGGALNVLSAASYTPEFMMARIS